MIRFKKIRLFLKLLLLILCIPISYLIIALVLTFSAVNNNNESVLDKHIYLSTNGVHLDIILPINYTDSLLLSGLRINQKHEYVAFGWGDKNFYINAPTWNDVTLSIATEALFLDSKSLMHVSHYNISYPDWVKVDVSEKQLALLQEYIYQGFQLDSINKKIILKDSGYSHFDKFYEAKGSYNLFFTCNSWVNTGLKNSGIKACVWTPFDFGLLKFHK